jgi:hypothetical protein
MGPDHKEVETEDLTQLLEIINAKGDEGELAEIVDRNKIRIGQSRAYIQDEALVMEEEKE